ncbi:MAG: ORF6N domain-containing protein [Mariprofundaceae bacterium]|nr:ORF6N domain-containing protein [Mariprofundaceae bacterium]
MIEFYSAPNSATVHFQSAGQLLQSGCQVDGGIMSITPSIMPVEMFERRILLIRRQKVMLDADLSDVYGVQTKRLNEQIKRNSARFPEDFIFKLTAQKKTQVVAICDHLAKLKYSSVLPYAFTEHGALMAASVLNTEKAVETSLFVIRAFVFSAILFVVPMGLLR